MGSNKHTTTSDSNNTYDAAKPIALSTVQVPRVAHGPWLFLMPLQQQIQLTFIERQTNFPFKNHPAFLRASSISLPSSFLLRGFVSTQVLPPNRVSLLEPFPDSVSFGCVEQFIFRFAIWRQPFRQGLAIRRLWRLLPTTFASTPSLPIRPLRRTRQFPTLHVLIVSFSFGTSSTRSWASCATRIRAKVGQDDDNQDGTPTNIHVSFQIECHRSPGLMSACPHGVSRWQWIRMMTGAGCCVRDRWV